MAATYAKDIRPLFRPQDITCMSKAGVRLGDTTWMCDPAGNNGFADHGNARHVYAALEKGVMPPDKKWPQAARQSTGRIIVPPLEKSSKNTALEGHWRSLGESNPSFKIENLVS